MLKFTKNSLIALSFMASAALASDVLVTVNGKNITTEDAQTFVSMQAPQANYSELKPEEQKMILDRLIEKQLFTELASTQGIEKQAEYKENLEKIKEELLVSIWMKEQLKNTIVSNSEAKEFYEKNKEKFVIKPSAHARHILVKNAKEAEAIIKTLSPLKGEALKSKFIALAKKESTGPSAVKGGDLGTFSKGQMVPAFSKAVWALNDGEITKTPVKTQFGYHIIYLEKKTKEETIPYNDVKEKIINSLKQQQFASKITELAKELKSKAKITEVKKISTSLTK